MIRRVRATFDDLNATIRNRPAEAVTALKKLFPDLPPRVIELAFELNSPSWIHPDLSEADLRKEIAMRKGGNIPNVDKLEPSSLLVPR